MIEQARAETSWASAADTALFYQAMNHAAGAL